MKKWFNKQTAFAFLFGVIICITLPAFADTRGISAFYNNIRLKINGQFIKTDVEPFVVNGRTMVPAKFIAEPLGATVKFNETENCVEIESLYNDQNIINYSNGDQYKGDIMNALPNGVGTYVWKNGSYYVGEFLNGKFNGPGYRSGSDGSFVFGNWFYGELAGKAYIITPKGNIYFAEYKMGEVINCVQLDNILNGTQPALIPSSKEQQTAPTTDTSAYEAALKDLKTA